MVKSVEIVSLSRGVLGEPFLRHELEIGERRLREYGLKVKYSENALKGLDYIEKHPEKRAEDLLRAFEDPETDMILCAIGGDDTYRLLPYLFGRDELKKAVRNKIFLGFSDTTINHFMLHKVGLNTFYGQSFLADVCELEDEMLPYTKKYFEELLSTGSIKEITPSEVWYEVRSDFGVEQKGKKQARHPNGGYELLQGEPVFRGRILGGCIDTIYDMFDGERYADMPELCRRYGLFPSLEDWRGKILLLESSEEKMPPEKYRRAIELLRDTGIFGEISGILAGKPMDEAYYEEYKQILKEAVGNPELPVLYNINIGHSLPRCIIPFGVEAVADAQKQKITFAE